MKKELFIMAAVVALLQACGKSQVEKDAEAVCDCLRKTKESGSLKEKSDCLTLQRTTGQKYMKTPEDMMTFNSIVTPCVMETLGQ